MQGKKLVYVDETNKIYRTVRTLEPVKRGDLLYETEAMALSIFDSKRGQYCDYCLKDKKDFLKCSQCNIFHYCDEKCQKNDWQQFHKEECHRFKSLIEEKYNVTNEFILNFRLYLICRQNEEFKKSVLHMKSHQELYSEEKIKEIKEASLKIVSILNDDKSQVDILSEIITKIHINFFTIEKPSFITNCAIGTGFYSGCANFFNHSCSPNAYKIFLGRKLLFFSAEDIQAGEEVFICYDENLGKPFSVRQVYLQEFYKMICSCRKCKKEGMVEFYNNIGLICEKCKKGVIENNECNNCKEKFENNQLKLRQEMIEKIIEEQISNEKLSVEEKIKLYQNLKNNLIDITSYFNEIILEKIISQITHQKNYELQAYKLLKLYVKNYNKWYDIEIPSLGFKYNELSRIAFSLNKGKKAKIFTEQALKHLSFYFKEESIREINELNERIHKIDFLLDAGNEIKKVENQNLFRID